MPPKKPVPSLKGMSMNKVLYNICAVILDEMYFSEDEQWEVFESPVLSVRLQAVRDILGNSLLPSILEDILNTILEKDEDVDTTVRFIALQLLLVEGVNSLNIGHFPEDFYTHVLDAVAHSAAELRKLDLKGLWVGNEHKFYLCKVLRRLGSIKNLTLRYKCDDELLGIIGKFCSDIQRLDISGSIDITDVGFKSLYEGPRSSQISKSLQIIDLGGNGSKYVSPNHVSLLLCNLPNLVSLGTYERTGAALQIAYKKNPDIKFGLRYLHDLFTTSERILIIIRTCPNLGAIYLDSPKNVSVHNLDLLKNLKEIKLHKVRWDDIKILLEKCGERIVSLILITIFGQLDLLEVGRLCPNLSRVELHRTSLICSATSHSFAFKKVSQVFIYTSEISTLCVKLILNQGTKIKHLSLGMCGQLTDAAVISCLMDHSLKEVEALWFGQADNLTMRTVDALLEHCPVLNSLGNLAVWNVSGEDISMKQIELILTNTDLVIHNIGPDDDDNRDHFVFVMA